MARMEIGLIDLAILVVGAWALWTILKHLRGEAKRWHDRDLHTKRRDS